ncbi:MAG: M24 family metallopeptidase, partial [Planctomycetes bacterium]|nr:M24 family metallopeptidase [Planctomycetota bacterium]
MARDSERRKRIGQALRQENLDAVVCTLPANVLLLSGYWPVVGTSLALATRDERVIVLAPRDELELARQGWAEEVHPFEPGSLQEIRTATEAVIDPLHQVAQSLVRKSSRIGYEGGPEYEPATYAGMHRYGPSIVGILKRAFPSSTLLEADDVLALLRAVKVPWEIDRIRTACRMAGRAFYTGAGQLRPGLKETEVAALFQAPLSTGVTEEDEVQRAGGFVFCMSGPNSAQAYGAYARSRSRQTTRGDLVLVHCNSYADGYWTDITRTF